MAVVDSVPIPKRFTLVLISSSDTNPISLGAAVAGQTVRMWGLVATGGTTVTFKQDSTAITGALAVTGLSMPLVTSARMIADRELAPYFQSVVGGTINIVPSASGMAGVAWVTQD